MSFVHSFVHWKNAKIWMSFWNYWWALFSIFRGGKVSFISIVIEETWCKFSIPIFSLLGVNKAMWLMKYMYILYCIFHNVNPIRILLILYCKSINCWTEKMCSISKVSCWKAKSCIKKAFRFHKNEIWLMFWHLASILFLSCLILGICRYKPSKDVLCRPDFQPFLSITYRVSHYLQQLRERKAFLSLFYLNGNYASHRYQFESVQMTYFNDF